MPARNEPRPSLLAKAGRSRLRRLANDLEERHGPGRAADGTTNLAGALRRAMATTGYSELKEFQRVEVVVSPRDEE